MKNNSATNLSGKSVIDFFFKELASDPLYQVIIDTDFLYLFKIISTCIQETACLQVGVGSISGTVIVPKYLTILNTGDGV